MSGIQNSSVANKKKIIFLIIAVAITLVFCTMLTGCSKKDTTATVDSGAADSGAEEPEPEEPVQDTGVYSVLTGLPIDADHANKRPVSCMVENTKMALPQYGLNRAGVVYECPVEGGITRLMAIFDNYDGMDKIGNVRSCRPYYAIISAEYDAIYVHYGQSVQGEALLNTGIVNDLNGLDGSVGGIVFYRTSDKKAPHNAYTSTDGINQGIATKGYDTSLPEGYEQHFKFYGAEEDNAIPNGTPCEGLKLYFSNNKPYYVYDKDSKTYKRYEFGAAETDAIDGSQCEAKNIIIENIPSELYPGGQYLNISMNGTGNGKYITDGTITDITWSKDSDSAITHYYYADGTEIQLNPGRTWVELCENSGVDKNTFYESADQMNQ